MRPNFFDFARYLPRGPYDRRSPCGQLGELICAVPGALRRWRRRARGRADLLRLSPRDLRDIGIAPSEAARECGKPFWRA
jgi:uncharacterized protein YjiS (DUF1127 family)